MYMYHKTQISWQFGRSMNNHCKFFTTYVDTLLRFDLENPVLCQPGDFIFDILCAIKLVYNLSRAIKN